MCGVPTVKPMGWQPMDTANTPALIWLNCVPVPTVEPVELTTTPRRHLTNSILKKNVGRSCVLNKILIGEWCWSSRMLVLTIVLSAACTITHSAPSRSSSAMLQEQRQQQDLEELERLALADMPSSNRLILQRQSVGDPRLSHYPKVSSPIKMHNFLGNILVQSENNRVAGNVRQKAEAAAAWHQQMDRTARDEMPTSTYRISQDSFSAAIKKILMGIH
uniref:Uncharacterized protein n=1 Tax=Ditylenchus dipsaci TaxID=166011 RepID=A0A915DP27_9BILA